MSFDADWFADCANTFHEEEKQLAYAPRMGLAAILNCAHPPTFDLQGRSVVDIGGGPVSLLLKTVNRGEHCTVIDPGEYPWWVRLRYQTCGIDYCQMAVEDAPDDEHGWDEAWIYNVLQHVRDPKQVIAYARRNARTIRVFDWIEIDPYPGHPHRLEASDLEGWLGGKGFVTYVNESGAQGAAFYGVFLAR